MDRPTALNTVIAALRESGVKKEAIQESDQLGKNGLGLDETDIIDFFSRLQNRGIYFADEDSNKMITVKEVVDFIVDIDT